MLMQESKHWAQEKTDIWGWKPPWRGPWWFHSLQAPVHALGWPLITFKRLRPSSPPFTDVSWFSSSVEAFSTAYCSDLRRHSPDIIPFSKGGLAAKKDYRLMRHCGHYEPQIIESTESQSSIHAALHQRILKASGLLDLNNNNKKH